MPGTGLESIQRRSRARAATLVACALAGGLILAPSTANGADYKSASGPRDDDGPRVLTAMSGGKLFFDNTRKISFLFRIRHSSPVDAKITVTKPRSGEVVERWKRTVTDGTEQVIRWNGLKRSRLQKERKYAFRLQATDRDGATTHSARAGDRTRDTFKLKHHRFPVRGKHQYWDGFGAGRDHQGTDVGAACGTKLQAARGGKVQYRGWHSAAGHYVVIDLRKSRRDFAYMHLERRARFGDGERVRTGQTIGTVGDSGNASGCHLHFEMWSGPGWYEGGRAIDSEPHLRKWDRYS